MTTSRSVILGVGSYLPERIVTNDELATWVDTSDDWIRKRTGIRARHFAARDEYTSHLATAAARNALADSGVAAKELDLIILATTTPDNTFPATASLVQRQLGSFQCAAFDIQAVCAGFIFAMATADCFLRTGRAGTALVIGAETFSRLLDWNDRSTCVLFGDGAGAVVLQLREGAGGLEDRGILAANLHTDGNHYDKLYVDGGPSTTGKSGFVRMVGREVFRLAVARTVKSIQTLLSESNLGIQDIDCFLMHQANERILKSAMERLGAPYEKAVVTIGDQGNTSAASLPLAMRAAKDQGVLKRGDLIVLEALGGGLSWGAMLARW